MKASLLFALILITCVSARAQGTVNFSNIGLGADVIDACMQDAKAEQGTRFSVALYFAPDGTTDPSLFTQLGDATHLIARGVYSGGTRTAPVSPPGFFGMFMVKVWETAYGSSFEEALSAPVQNGRFGLFGRSSIVRVDTGDPTTLPPGTPASLKGISGITLFTWDCVPEPSPIALGVLAAAVLSVLRKSKQQM